NNSPRPESPIPVPQMQSAFHQRAQRNTFRHRDVRRLSALRRDYVPASRKSRTEGAADKHVVVHIPYRRLARARVVKQIIRFAVPVEIGHADQFPAAGEGWAEGASDKRDAGKIPDGRLTRAGAEE